MAEQSHHGTFEAGPSGHINGESVQLVYAAVRDRSAPLDYTFQALKASIEAEGAYYGRSREDDEETHAGRIIARAEKFLAFLHSEDESGTAS